MPRAGLEVQKIVFRVLPASGWSRHDARSILPAAGDRITAIRAGAGAQAIFGNVMPRAADQGGSTLGTRGVGSLRKNIALVDVAQPHFASDGAGAMQRFGRRARLILQFEIGMKGGEVQGNVGPEMFENPFREAARLTRVIVERRDHEVGDLEPDIGFVL